MIYSKRGGVREIRTGDWIVVDEQGRILIYSESSFGSIFIEEKSSEGSRSVPLYMKREVVLVKHSLSKFTAFCDTVYTCGNTGDYLVQDSLYPYHQWVQSHKDFMVYYTPYVEEHGPRRGFSFSAEDALRGGVRSSVWGPVSLDSKPSPSDDEFKSDTSLSSPSQRRVCMTLTEKNAERYRQKKGSLAVTLQEDCTLWKRHSGEGGRCAGRAGDIAVFHLSGDFEGMFSPSEFAMHFRHETVDVQITCEFQGGESYDNPDSSTYRFVTRQYDVLAMKMTQPFVAHCNGLLQYGYECDFLLQPYVPCDRIRTQSCHSAIDIESCNDSTCKSDESEVEGTDISIHSDLHSEGQETGTHLSDCQWVVSALQFQEQYLALRQTAEEKHLVYLSEVCDSTPIEVMHSDSDLNIGSRSRESSIRSTDNTGCASEDYVCPFKVYSSKTLCWTGEILKRSKLLRQWQKKTCELYPDKLVLCADSAVPTSLQKSKSTGALTTPLKRSTTATEKSDFILLQYVTVHTTVIDGNPAIYLGNARLNSDEGSKPLSLEPYYVTVSQKRWESRYSKWFKGGGSSNSTSISTSEQSSMDDSCTRISLSNANGIFLMVTDKMTHNLLCRLLDECVLHCRRHMAFEAASKGDPGRVLEVLSSVAPEQAMRILNSPKDIYSGRLLQHEAAVISADLLKEIFQIGDDALCVPTTNSFCTLRTCSNSDRQREVSIDTQSGSEFMTLDFAATCTLGMNCLHYAVQADNLEALKYLLDNSRFGIDVNSRSLSGQTPLHCAKSSSATSLLLQHDADPEAADNEGNTPLMLMASRGSSAAITRLVRDAPRDSIDLNAQSWKTGSTALGLSLYRLSGPLSNYSESALLVELLLHYGADPNMSDVQNNSCLHAACSIYRAACSDSSTDLSRRRSTQIQIETCAKIIKILVDYGCDKMALNNKGQIPLSIVCQAKNYVVDTVPVSNIIDPLVFSKQSVTRIGGDSEGIEDSGGEENADVVKTILNFRTTEGLSPLHLAVQAGNAQITKYLLEKGVDANCKDLKGCTPLDILKRKQERVGNDMAEKHVADLMDCMNVLYEHGAVCRLRADLPVEQDSDVIKFSREMYGKYSVKSATLSAMVKRLCNERLYSDEDARAIALAYKVVCSDIDFLLLIREEFDALVRSVWKARAESLSESPVIDDTIELLNVNNMNDWVEGDIPEVCSSRIRRRSLSTEIEDRSRPICEDIDMPHAAREIGSSKHIFDHRPFHYECVNNTEDGMAVQDSCDDIGVLYPGGVLSLLMIWFNLVNFNSDLLQARFVDAVKEFATVTLKTCPEELSRESIVFLQRGLAEQNTEDLIDGFRCVYRSKQNHSSTVSRKGAFRHSEIEAIDNMLLEHYEETVCNLKAFKLLGVDSANSKRLVGIRPIDFVQQVTVMQHHLFKKIPQSELLSLKYRCADICPNLNNMRNWNTEVTHFLINEVLRCPDEGSRVHVISYIITAGFAALETMNNFDFCVIVLGVLESTSIYRLKSTWEKVEKRMPGKRASFKKSLGIGGRNVTALMKKSTPPLIPYLGLYLQQMINLHEIPSIVKVENCAENHLNVSKYRKIASIIHEFQQAQNVSYRIDFDMNVHRVILQTLQWRDEDAFLARSKEIEPPIVRA
eukprot:CAMPEP_0185037316 /NCGR_PEP_ID=MMETSP1103-20130426/31543_1 /TAXON_ID=36769 /ORGANISM="Paraphysomonas bandaiensis, Strain Caron Lab Isolate" /LENGTH=1633 /DNA_ID=CAMNT_0027575239 /DNA_START=173 /DNA_END=5074 /DNA_ORIENTATION=-